MAAKEERIDHIASMFNSFQENLNSEQQKREVKVCRNCGLECSLAGGI